MINRLKNKWKVSGLRLVLILVTFATGGSLTGLIGKKLMSYTDIENTFIYFPLYIILITFIWPVMVIVISIPLGQFNFFKAYLGKMIRRFRGTQNRRINERA
jgi:hypothetical protein